MDNPDLWQTITSHPPDSNDATSLWEIVSDKLDPYRYRPHRIEQVTVAHFKRVNGTAYHVLKNKAQATYVRLDEQGYFLWALMDGRRTVKDLMVDYFMQYRRLGQDNILHLISYLSQKGFLRESRQNVYAHLRRKTTPRTLSVRLLGFRSFLLRKTFTVHGIDHHLQRLYQHGFRIFFSRPARWLIPVLLLVGIWIFWDMLQTGRYSLYRVADSAGLGLLVLIGINALMVSIHEGAHALTLKHYRLDAPSGGLVFYFGLPCFFIDATDAWMAPKRQRIIVALAGPYSTTLFSSVMVVVLSLFPDFPGSNMLFKIALWGYVSALINLYPLLEFDGYYILVDVLDIPMLRRKAFSFLRRQLPTILLQRQALTRREWILTAYGLLSFLSTGALILLSLVIIHWRLENMWGGMYSSNPWITRILVMVATGLFAVPVALSLMALVTFGMVRTIRWIKNTRIWENVNTVIVLGGSIIVSYGIGIGLLIPDTTRSILLDAAQFLGGVMTVWGSILAWRHRAGCGVGRALLVFGAMGLGAVVVGLLNLTDAGQAQSERSVDWGMAVTGTCGLIILIIYRVRNGPQVSDHPSRRVWPVIGTGLGMMTAGYILMDTTPISFMGPICTGLAFPMCALGLWAFVLTDRRLAWRFPALDSKNLYRDREYLGMLFDYFSQGLMQTLGRVEGVGARSRLTSRFNKQSDHSRLNLHLTPGGYTEQDTLDDIFSAAGRYKTALHLLVDAGYARLGKPLIERMLVALYDNLSWQERERADEYLLPGSPWGDRLRSGSLPAQDDLDLVRTTALFQDLPEPALQQLGRAFFPVIYNADRVVVREGDPGDRFYLIKSGIAMVTRMDQDVEQVLTHLYPGDYFGEVALLRHVPRTATVRAATNMTVLALERATFNSLLRGSLSLFTKIEDGIELLQFLHPIPLFTEFAPRQLSAIMTRFESVSRAPDETIIRAGDMSDRFYLIKSGEVNVYREQDGHTEHIATLGPGEYFGEIAMIKDIPRTATVVSATAVELLALERSVFDVFILSHIAASRHLELVAGRRLYELDLRVSEEPSL